MRFLVDQQLPPLLAEALKDAGHDAVHIRDLGLSTASDHAIWAEARQTMTVVISRDEDFVRLVRDPGGARLVWIRLGNCTNAHLLATIQAAWPAILTRLDEGEVLIEVRG